MRVVKVNENAFTPSGTTNFEHGAGSLTKNSDVHENEVKIDLDKLVSHMERDLLNMDDFDKFMNNRYTLNAGKDYSVSRDGSMITFSDNAVVGKGTHVNRFRSEVGSQES